MPSAQGGVSEQGSGAPARPGRSGRPLGQSWRGARPCITPTPSTHSAPSSSVPVVILLANRLASRSKLTKVERAPFWVYCSLLWVHVEPPGL